MKRTLLITGASSGIGRSIAEKLLDAGHRVIGLSRSFKTFQSNPNHYRWIECDCSNLEKLPAFLSNTLKQHPDIDGAILCAGRGQFSSLEEFSFEQIRSLIDLNFTSQALISRALIPTLKKKQLGDLIFLGSEAALKGTRKGSVYCATKFALRGFSEALREECRSSNVRVTLINPGLVNTEFFDPLNFRPGKHESNYILPDDIADLIQMILTLRRGTSIDEINLSPLKKVIQFDS